MKKRYRYIKMSYYSERGHCKNKIKVELALSNFVTKSDLKNESGVGILKFAKTVDLANLKSEVDKAELDKLKTVPVDLSTLNNVVRNDVVKNSTYE